MFFLWTILLSPYTISLQACSVELKNTGVTIRGLTEELDKDEETETVFADILPLVRHRRVSTLVSRRTRSSRPASA